MLFNIVLTLGLFTAIHGNIGDTDKCPNIKTSLNSIRQRRHLAFPDDTDVVLTISLAKAFHTHVPSGWMIVLDLDVHYPLPDAKFTAAHARRKLHHRQKKDIWQRIQEALDMHNMNGHACILRSICEAKTRLASKGQSLVHDILRSIFTVPHMDDEFREEIEGSFDATLDPELCQLTHECHFSLLDFILDFNRPK